ncbi:hypothetical protein HanPI659440_Chr12g0466341 [Helianthus annuus]|nr:hypothetical protein HanPI659440_Chr12g0466341 [Helianthus annuus]
MMPEILMKIMINMFSKLRVMKKQGVKGQMAWVWSFMCQFECIYFLICSDICSILYIVYMISGLKLVRSLGN